MYSSVADTFDSARLQRMSNLIPLIPSDGGLQELLDHLNSEEYAPVFQSEEHKDKDKWRVVYEPEPIPRIKRYQPVNSISTWTHRSNWEYRPTAEIYSGTYKNLAGEVVHFKYILA